MQKLLTIVVPVYKVEQYINKCLDSCIIYKAEGTLDEEKMNQLEVIIVNDGTPDRSAEMSREYTVRYPQTFRQIDQENRGHGGAWNHGLKEATGKYLRFLDSDDWLTNLDKLMEKLAGTDADIILTDYIKVQMTSNHEEIITINSKENQVLPLTIDFLYHQYHSSYTLNFWQATYKTSILQPQEPLFAEHVMYDDSILSLAPLLYGRTYMYLHLPIYHYLIGRPGQSMDAKVIARNVNSYFRCYEQQVQWMKNALQYKLPDEFNKCIQETVQHYAGVVFGHLVCLRYKEAKRKMAYYYKEAYTTSIYTTTINRSKMVRRYEKLPFFIFYIIEQIRNWKNTI